MPTPLTIAWRTPVFVLSAALAASTPLAGAPRERPPAPASLAELWVQPTAERDLFYGPGGRALAPDPGVRYRVVGLKFGGFSDGYDVRGPDGREWSAKFPPEAAPEVVASRIHWGIGYHQPPIYLLREWNAEHATAPNPQLPARFREDEPAFHGLDHDGSWALDDNPFVGTRQLAGLLVLEAMLGNSDLKKSNTTIYTLDEPVHGAARWYAVRDLGQSFGRTGTFEAPRGDVEAFERTGFIRGVDGDRVVLDYHGGHTEFFDDITVADVRWICEQLDRLSDRQWQDAFRAGAYEPHTAGRFIAKLKSKIAQGLALQAAGGQAVNADAATVQEFRKRVDAFVAAHRRAESGLPRLSNNATPEEIDANERSLAGRLRDARADAAQGDIFTPDMQTFVRRVIARVLSGPDGANLRGVIMDENPGGVKIRVNQRYPDEVPLTTMPAQLLAELPEMPEELEYRFVGDNFIILDPHAHVIVDFVPDALPKN